MSADQPSVDTKLRQRLESAVAVSSGPAGAEEMGQCANCVLGSIQEGLHPTLGSSTSLP